MSELEDKLNSILGDPQAMGQIMALARSLGDKGGAPSPPPPPENDTGAQPPDLSALMGALTGGGEGGLDPRLLKVLGRVMESSREEDDQRTALLMALRPYVKEKRYARLDRAVQLARLSRLVRAALDVFKGGEQDV